MYFFFNLLADRRNERNGRREDLDAREKQDIHMATRRSLESYKEEGDFEKVLKMSEEETIGQHQLHSANDLSTFDQQSHDNQLRNRFSSVNAPYPPYNPDNHSYGTFSESVPCPGNSDIQHGQYPGQQTMHQNLRELDEPSTMISEPSAPTLDLYSVD